MKIPGNQRSNLVGLNSSWNIEMTGGNPYKCCVFKSEFWFGYQKLFFTRDLSMSIFDKMVRRRCVMQNMLPVFGLNNSGSGSRGPFLSEVFRRLVIFFFLSGLYLGIGNFGVFGERKFHVKIVIKQVLIHFLPRIMQTEKFNFLSKYLFMKS